MIVSALGGLFVAAFLAATPVPFQSEILFVGLLLAGSFDLWAVVIVASVGNVLGSFVTYAAGRGLVHFRGQRWFPIRPDALARAEGWFRRWGVWVLLLSWAPGGDLMVAMAGVLRTPLWLFALLVTLSKTGRYVVLAGLTQAAVG